MAIRKLNNEVTKATKDIMDITDGFINEFLQNNSDYSMFENMTGRDLEMIQESIKLYKNYKALAVLTARRQDEIYNMLEELNEKIDKMEKAK